MLDGGLVYHYEQRRDTSLNAAARRDAERVLEDLRSLCRAAQAFEEQHGAPASLRDFLEHAVGLRAQELGAGEDRRVTVSMIHRAKGTEAFRLRATTLAFGPAAAVPRGIPGYGFDHAGPRSARLAAS